MLERSANLEYNSREMKRDIETNLDTAEAILNPLRFDEQTTILDLGCGSGVFVEAALRRFQQQRIGLNNPELLATLVAGVEIDRRRVTLAKRRLSRRFGRPASGWRLEVADALTFSEDRLYDFVIGNPPWVRVHHLSQPTKELARQRFQVAKGMFDLCHVFIEKAIRLLKPDGHLCLIVPAAIRSQPAAAPIRDFLDANSSWELEPLNEYGFMQSASVTGFVLRARKNHEAGSAPIVRKQQPVLSLGSICKVSTGTATGADSIFLVDMITMIKYHLEPQALRPAIRGRDVTRGEVEEVAKHLIWPYTSREDGRWTLAPLEQWPAIAEYLARYKVELASRPRLAQEISNYPTRWYKFIDPRANEGQYLVRFAIPDILRLPAFATIRGDMPVVMNTCFQLRPREADTVLRLLKTPEFWERLKAGSRPLQNGYYRTSVSELRNLDIYGILE